MKLQMCHAPTMQSNYCTVHFIGDYLWKLYLLQKSLIREITLIIEASGPIRLLTGRLYSNGGWLGADLRMETIKTCP